jgi:GNAT superfamily N-acetyltransferase
MLDFVRRAGGAAELVGGAVCVSQAPLTDPIFNRALPVEPRIDLTAIATWFGDRTHVVCVTPANAALEPQLEARGYSRGYAWMKFERDADPPPTVESDLRVAETTDVEAFTLAGREGFGLPPELESSFGAIVGAPGWHCFVAWAGAEPAACAALFVDGEAGWLGLGATRPAFRRRGGQGALLAARLETARALGLTTVATETGERVDGRPSDSYRNILRAGFGEAYVRANWSSPLRRV